MGRFSISAVDPFSVFSRERYSVVVYRVDSEDPWRVRPILRHGGLGWGEAEEFHSKLVETHEAEGYSCYERGASSHVLCVKPCYAGVDGEPVLVGVDRFLIALEPDDELDNEAGEGV